MRAALVQETMTTCQSWESCHGGHFGPTTEATIALHGVQLSPGCRDSYFYDVSHQTYPHKMLTGRKQAYMDPRSTTKCLHIDPAETPHDLFCDWSHLHVHQLGVWPGKVAISWAARRTSSVIGDGSMSGHAALEGSNVAGELNSNFIIVFNDNQMSIAENYRHVRPVC